MACGQSRHQPVVYSTCILMLRPSRATNLLLAKTAGRAASPAVRSSSGSGHGLVVMLAFLPLPPVEGFAGFVKGKRAESRGAVEGLLRGPICLPGPSRRRWRWMIKAMIKHRSKAGSGGAEPAGESQASKSRCIAL